MLKLLLANQNHQRAATTASAFHLTLDADAAMIDFHADPRQPQKLGQADGLLMHTRAVATPMLDQDRPGNAIQVINQGIDQIHEFLDEYDLNDKQEACQELQNLEGWLEEVLSKTDWEKESEPTARIELLKRQLRDAIENEAFEEAASLRDEIRRLSDPPTTDP